MSLKIIKINQFGINSRKFTILNGFITLTTTDIKLTTDLKANYCFDYTFLQRVITWEKGDGIFKETN